MLAKDIENIRKLHERHQDTLQIVSRLEQRLEQISPDDTQGGTETTRNSASSERTMRFSLTPASSRARTTAPEFATQADSSFANNAGNEGNEGSTFRWLAIFVE
jgi:hypothetical protein